MTMERPSNDAIAEALEHLADRLAEREANPHRVQAYRTAAQTARSTEQPLAALLEQGGPEALKELPGIGESLASRIGGFVQTGRLLLLLGLAGGGVYPAVDVTVDAVRSYRTISPLPVPGAVACTCRRTWSARRTLPDHFPTGAARSRRSARRTPIRRCK